MNGPVENIYEVRKKKLIKQTLMVALGYFIVMIAIVAAKYCRLTSIARWQIIFCTVLAIGGMFIYILAILPMKKVSSLTANIVYFTQFLLWLVLYGFFVFWLNEIRIVALLFAVMALVFVLSNSTFIQSFTLSVGATAVTLAASYISIYHLGQKGSFYLELFFILCFLPSAVYLSYMAGEFKRQRKEISRARKEAEKTRDALWGEMELAHKIQTVLLPRSPNIDGYEIATFMEPADEVGGDYYDIINVKEKNWIVIGDVSGHGVPAGLVMMMVQTSIHLALDNNPDSAPSDLLVSINRIISQNIRQLGDDKYMTITVFAAMEGGRFFYSGLHQDIMVYRADTKTVELIETRGIWIGIMDDIDGMLDDDHFKINVGDIILVYTDGITEAWIEGSVRDERDPETEMYGDEQLKRVFLENGHRPVYEIKEAIIESLSGYEHPDDITLMLFRRLK